MALKAALIGLDWGTTSFRGYRIDAGGAVIEEKAASIGILQIEGGAFEAAFERVVGPWLAAEPSLPVVASGMIASRQGWVEAPYLECPADTGDLAAALLRHRTGAGRLIHFVPGLSLVGDDGVPDVMRGEETQILGELAEHEGGRLMVLPGTHSKWALAADGRVHWFATFMTGELFAVLRSHSILGRLMRGDAPDDDAFLRGVEYGHTSDARSGGLLKRLFSTRTLALFDDVPATGIASYLSGLLIGSEIREVLGCIRARASTGEATIVGGSDLADLYAIALDRAGFASRRTAASVVAAGHFRIARAAGLVR